MDHSILAYVRDRCVTSPALLVALVLGNAIVAAAYLYIPRLLDGIVREVGPGAPGATEIRGTARFVRSCGCTHVASIGVLFWPGLDWPAIVVLAATGAVSVAFAVRLRAHHREIVRELRAARELRALRSANG